MIPAYSLRNRLRCLWRGGHFWCLIPEKLAYVERGETIEFWMSVPSRFCFWCYRRDYTITFNDYTPEDYV